MPSLTPEDQERLLGQTQECPDCKTLLTRNYCRECDEFFWEGSHDQFCFWQTLDNQHKGHRTY